MNRRTLLSTFGTAGIGGCFGLREEAYDLPEPAPPPEIPSGGSRSVEATAGPPRRLVVSEDPSRGSDALEGRFLEPPSSEGPALLRITYTNTGDVARAFRFGPAPPLSARVGRPFDDGDPALLLVPEADAEAIVEEAAGGCWRAAEVPPEPTGTETVALEAGETVENTYALLVSPDADCPPTGAHRFVGERGTLFVSAWDPGAVGPGDSRFAGRTVPDLTPSTVPVAWFHEATESTTVFVEPTVERLAPPGDEVGFSLSNYGDRPLTIVPSGWGIHRLEGERWRQRYPAVVPSQTASLPPGETAWTTHRIDTGGDSGFALEPGTYAYHAGSRAHAALFVVEG